MAAAAAKYAVAAAGAAASAAAPTQNVPHSYGKKDSGSPYLCR